MSENTGDGEKRMEQHGKYICLLRRDTVHQCSAKMLIQTSAGGGDCRRAMLSNISAYTCHGRCKANSTDYTQVMSKKM